MTRLELSNLISYWADDVNKTYFTSDKLNAYLNNAYKKVFKMLVQASEDHFLKTVYTALVSGQQDYLLPSDFYNVRKVEVFNSTPTVTGDRYRLDPVTLLQMDNYLYSGDPLCYSLKKNSIILRPVPNSVKYLALSYIYTPSWFASDGQVPEIPEVYHELIAVEAAIDCFIQDGRNAELLFNKRERFENDFKAQSDERIKQGPRMIRAADPRNGSVF